MERGGRASEDSQSDPSPEWTVTGGETGLEEPMWRLGLGGGEAYPERPGEADCLHYLKTGYCGYGSRCRFNHPRGRAVVIGTGRTRGGEYPERVGQPVCQYYMRTGMCRFAASCKYHHPKQGGGGADSINPMFNYYGFPLRPGEKECSYYLKTGDCKFGATCKFHHPQPAGIQVPATLQVPSVPQMPVSAAGPAMYHTLQAPSLPSSQQYGLMVARPPVMQGSFVQSPYGSLVFSPVPLTGWSPYLPTVSPVVPPGSQSNIASTPHYGFPQVPSSLPAYAIPYQPSPSPAGPSSSGQKEITFPERPGQPECQYYMKTGDCKYGPSCRYHHPPEISAVQTNVLLSPMGLPLRPDAAKCTHYTQRGVCKYGLACKFDHPMGMLSYIPSASSLTDMPVVPLSVGYSVGSLAPSSSSSELLQPEVTSGSSNESHPVTMPSSMISSTESVGLSLSVGGTVSNSAVQPATKGPNP